MASFRPTHHGVDSRHVVVADGVAGKVLGDAAAPVEGVLEPLELDQRVAGVRQRGPAREVAHRTQKRQGESAKAAYTPRGVMVGFVAVIVVGSARWVAGLDSGGRTCGTPLFAIKGNPVWR